jgi:hypothetical protein
MSSIDVSDGDFRYYGKKGIGKQSKIVHFYDMILKVLPLLAEFIEFEVYNYAL